MFGVMDTGTKIAIAVVLAVLITAAGVLVRWLTRD
ncbi:hypothetical protein M2271_007030 [Streptomyces sp. LBL]|nr:hypothetical protein [Streptomyces sp. LBL]